MTSFSTGQVARGSLAVTKVGTEGKIRIRNGSSGTVHVVVDLQGWFANPLQELTPESFTRMTVMQGSPDGTAVRKVTFAYTDNAGVLRMGSADPSAWGFIAWTAISGQQAYTGPPSLHQRPDSKVQVAAQNIDTNIWSAAETSSAGGVFEAPSSLGCSMAGPPTGVRLDNGGSPVEVLFAVDADSRLWHYRQAGTAWSWTSLGVAGLTGQVTVVEESDNAVRLVARSTTGTVRTALYYPDGALSTWTDLGGQVTGTPTAVVHPGFRSRVVVRGSDGAVLTKVESATGSWSAQWERIGDFTAAGSPAAVMDPDLSRVAVVARGADDELYQIFETATGAGTWGQWRSLNPDPWTPLNVATDPTVATISTGSTQSFVIAYRNRNGAIGLAERRLDHGAGLRGAEVAEMSFEHHTLPPPAE
ncbi:MULTISPECIES: hypothetical protein [unclassified Micromonospora]|uniref:hypothetical protein n=1 Tax=unclassified Micromonospora TaxID=2617518 RepID=UPI001035364B|nr:hypothetical protein [Verrucosispora sp. SN26_14.1]TBL33313.1 hypothetical protein EYA84_17605 [Verrucosispora sp. SN26_14.1]